jgi:hypothetical protein
MNAAFIALTLAFTTPGDDYHRDLIVGNIGTTATIALCDQALIAPDQAQRFAGKKELTGMRRTHEGVCLEGSETPGASMFVEVVASVPGIHLQSYKAATLPHFATVDQCNAELPKLAGLVPAYMDQFVDVWGTCYATK